MITFKYIQCSRFEKHFKLSLFTICMSSVHLKNTSSGEEQISIQNFIKEKNCTVKRKTIQTRPLRTTGWTTQNILFEIFLCVGFSKLLIAIIAHFLLYNLTIHVLIEKDNALSIWIQILKWIKHVCYLLQVWYKLLKVQCQFRFCYL